MQSSNGVLQVLVTMAQNALTSSSESVHMLHNTMLHLSTEVDSCLLGKSWRLRWLSTFSFSMVVMAWWTRIGTDITQDDAQEPWMVAVFWALCKTVAAFMGRVSAILMASSRSMDGAI